jgi:hypothetical protein
MDLMWVLMLRITTEVDSSNFSNIIFFKPLNNLYVAHIVANMFQTATIRSMDCPIPSSISCEVNNSYELQAIIDSFEKS